MSVKTKLLTSVAAMTLVGGAAFAEENTETAEQMPKAEIAQTDYAPGWNADMDERYGEIADRRVADLVGINVVSENGDDVGEIDTFIILDDRLQAVVGVGGFLGLGEHDVALPLDELAYDGQRLIIAYTEEELEAMPEYTEELHEARLNDEDTFRTRTGGMVKDTDTASTEMDETMPKDEDSTAMNMADGDIEDADEADAPGGEEVAAAEEAAGDEDTMTEEVAEAEKGEIEQESEELAAEADATVTEAGKELEETAEATGDAIGEGAEETERMAEQALEEGAEEVAEAGEATENAIEEGVEDVAAAGAAAGDAIADGAEEAEQMAENAAAETEQALEEGAEEVAEAGEATENAIEEGTDEVAEAGDAAAAEVAEWKKELDTTLAALNVNPDSVIGTNVATTNGEVIGEVDGIARKGDAIVALVGIGGFLGLGEHDVALTMEAMSYDGEKFIAEGYTEAELKDMPEYDEDVIERIDLMEEVAIVE